MYLLGTGRWAQLVLLPQGPPGVPWEEWCQRCTLWCKHEVIHLQLLLQRGRIERVHLVTSWNILQREHSTVETAYVSESRHFCFYHVSELLSCVATEQRGSEAYTLQRLLWNCWGASLTHLHDDKFISALLKHHKTDDRLRHSGSRSWKAHTPPVSLTSCHHHSLCPHLPGQPEAACPNPVWKP